MPSLGNMALKPRNDIPFGYVDEDGILVPWWYSSTGLIVKYSVIGAVMLLTLLFLVGGYLHAQSRQRKGLPPMAYHSYFFRRTAQPPQPYAHGWVPQGNAPPPESYYMHNEMPPPTYDPSRPPVYQGPPDGGSKVDPSQWRSTQTNPGPGYGAPAGPPPAMR